MTSIQGKLIDPWHVELTEPVPAGENRIEVRFVDPENGDTRDVPLLTRNPTFGFFRDEPDLYE